MKICNNKKNRTTAATEREYLRQQNFVWKPHTDVGHKINSNSMRSSRSHCRNLRRLCAHMTKPLSIRCSIQNIVPISINYRALTWREGRCSSSSSKQARIFNKPQHSKSQSSISSCTFVSVLLILSRCPLSTLHSICRSSSSSHRAALHMMLSILFRSLSFFFRSEFKSSSTFHTRKL
jgi:hypothetical protein